MILGISAAFSLRAGLWNLGMEGHVLGGDILHLDRLLPAGSPGLGIDIVGFLIAAAAGFLWVMILPCSGHFCRSTSSSLAFC